MSKNVSVILLLLIMGLSAFLSLYKIGGSDFMMADEYIYFNGANIGMDLRKTVCNIGDIVRNGEIGPAISRAIKEMPNFGRPGYHLLSAIATFIGGRSKVTAFCLSASIGVLSILVAYLLTLKLFQSRRIAIIASALLAVQGGYVLHERTAQQTPGVMLFFMLALYFYIMARQDKDRPAALFIVSAACLGFAFSVHPSAAFLVPLFLIMELQRCLFEPSDRSFLGKAALMIKNLSIFYGAFICSILLWEVPRFLTHIYFIARGKIGIFSNYFTALTPINNIGSYIHENIFRSIEAPTGLKLSLGSFKYLPSFLIDSQGVLYLITLAAAVLYLIVVTFRRLSDYRPMLIAVWAGAVYIFYSGIDLLQGCPPGFRELRHYLVIFPAICIMLALFLERFFQKKGAARAIGSLLFLVIFFSSIAHSWEIVTSQFSYRAINEYLKNNPSIDKVAINANLMGMALPEEVIDNLDGFVIADSSFMEDGKTYVDIKGSRLGVLYRDKDEFNKNRIFKADPGQGRLGVGWPKDLIRLHKEGKVRYLLTSMVDEPWMHYDSIPNNVKPIFSVKSPFVCRSRIYDVGVAPNLDKFFNTPYFQRVGIYDLNDVFPEKTGER